MLARPSLSSLANDNDSDGRANSCLQVLYHFNPEKGPSPYGPDASNLAATTQQYWCNVGSLLSPWVWWQKSICQKVTQCSIYTNKIQNKSSYPDEAWYIIFVTYHNDFVAYSWWSKWFIKYLKLSRWPQ